MKEQEYRKIEEFMQDCMKEGDAAHDREHVCRVLQAALKIAETEPEADRDILTAACLLHDVGRKEQMEDPSLDHAVVGAEKAKRFLLEEGFDPAFAGRVSACIATHRYRSDNPPESIEAKILFDADKLDVTGAMGAARTLLYQGALGEPLYTKRPAGKGNRRFEGGGRPAVLRGAPFRGPRRLRAGAGGTERAAPLTDKNFLIERQSL